MEFVEWRINPATKPEFLAGYTSIRPLSPYHEKIMPLICLVKSMAILGFTVKIGTWDNRDAKLYHVNYQFIETFFK